MSPSMKRECECLPCRFVVNIACKLTGHAYHRVWIVVRALEMITAIIMPCTLGVENGLVDSYCFRRASSKGRWNGGCCFYPFVRSFPAGIRRSSCAFWWYPASGLETLTGEIEPSIWLWCKRPFNSQPFALQQSLCGDSTGLNTWFC